MMDTLHIYELSFFAIFILAVYFLAVPKIKVLLLHYDFTQKQEYNRLHGKYIEFLDEYQKENMEAKAADESWYKFEKSAEDMQKQFNLEEKMLCEAKLENMKLLEYEMLKNVATKQRQTIFSGILDHVKSEVYNSSDTTNFENQFEKMSEYFNVKPNL